MDNLFSIFDPKSTLLYINWLSFYLPLTLLSPILFWATPGQPLLALTQTLSALHQEFKAILGKLALPRATFLPISVFLLIWFNNFIGLSPYTFTATSHIRATLRLALPLWIGHVTYAWWKTPSPILAHLVPQGRPAALSPFMVIIELVRAVIRPLTLSVRLAANIVAGHLLMVLMSSPAAGGRGPLVVLILSGLILLATLETAVATIQAYVFRILSLLYINEVNSPPIIDF